MMPVRWMTLARSRYATPLFLAALGGALVGVAALLPRLRAAEVHLAAVVLAFVMFPDAHVPRGADIVYFTLTGGQPVGIEIDTQSSVALLALPLLLVALAIVFLRPDDAGRALLALLAAVGGLVVENQFRVLLTAILLDNTQPQDRGSIGATVFGSMCTVLCLAVGILLFVFVFAGTRRRAPVVLTGQPPAGPRDGLRGELGGEPAGDRAGKPAGETE